MKRWRLAWWEFGRTPDGSHVISMAQPYSSYAKGAARTAELSGHAAVSGRAAGPALRRDGAHAAILRMGVDVRTLDKPFAGDVAREDFSTPARTESFAASDNHLWLAINRIWKSGGTVWRDPATGDFAVTQKGAGWGQLRRPRIGLYKVLIPANDEGWTRWLL